MTVLAWQIGIAVFGIAAVAWLLSKARKSSAQARKVEADAAIKAAEVKAHRDAVGYYVYYTEYSGDLSQFFQSVRAEEEDSAAEASYAALESVGAASIIPLLRDAESAHVAFHRQVNDLDYEQDADEIAAAEQEYSARIGLAEAGLRDSGVSVTKLLEDFEKRNAKILAS